jgi:DnaJ-domain-containing protein 1
MRKGSPRPGPDATPSERDGATDAGAGAAEVPWWAQKRAEPSAANRWDHTPTPEELRERFKKKRRRPVEEPKHTEFDSDALFTRLGTSEPDRELASEELLTDVKPPADADYFYDPDDPWQILGVPRGASWDEITVAHKRLAKLHHPDMLATRSPEEREASEARMRDVNVAYSVLRRRLGR